MTNCEHLIENALMSMNKAKEKGIDIYEAFLNAMKCKHNQIMLNEVSLTKDELWEIAQYIVFVHDVCMKSDFEVEMENRYGYRLGQEDCQDKEHTKKLLKKYCWISTDVCMSDIEIETEDPDWEFK